MDQKNHTEFIEDSLNLETTRTETHQQDVDPLSIQRTIDVDNYHGLSVKIVLVYLALSLLLCSQMLNLIAAGSLARPIAASIGGADKSAWLSAIVAIESVAFSLPLSQAADFWGRKWFLVVPTVFGCAGAIIISRATSMNMAIAGQALASVSFGAQPLAFAIGSEILPRKWRPEAQAGLNCAFSIGAIGGLLVGAKLVQTYHDGFRIFYYILAATYAIAAIVCVFFYNPQPRPLQLTMTFRQKIAKLDWIGYTLFIAGLVLLLLGLFWYSNPYAFTNVHVLAPFIIGCVLFIAFGLYEWKGTKEGVLHHDLQVDRNLALGLFAIFVEGMVFFSVAVYYVFEMSVVYDTDSFISSVRFAVIFIVSTVAAVLGSKYMSTYLELRIPSVLGFAFFILFMILMATATTSSGTAMWGFSIFIGFGIGLVLISLVTAAQLSAPPQLIAITSGLLLAVRPLGGAIGLAIYTAIFNTKIATNLPKEIASAVLPLGFSPVNLGQLIQALASGSQEAIFQVPGVTPAIVGAAVHGLKKAYLESFRYIWVAAAAMSVLAMIASAFLLNPTREMTMHVDAPLEEDEKLAKEVDLP